MWVPKLGHLDETEGVLIPPECPGKYFSFWEHTHGLRWKCTVEILSFTSWTAPYKQKLLARSWQRCDFLTSQIGISQNTKSRQRPLWRRQDFPGGSEVKTELLGAQVPCLGRELKSHMPKKRERYRDVIVYNQKITSSWWEGKVSRSILCVSWIGFKKKKNCPSLSIEVEVEVMHWNGSFPVFPETVLSPRRPQNCQVCSFPWERRVFLKEC